MSDRKLVSPEEVSFEGYLPRVMSDEFLLDCFDRLCVRTERSDDWLDEWNACKDEIMRRMKGDQQ